MVPAVLSPPDPSLKACEHYETIVSIVSNPPKEVIELYTSLDDAFALLHRAVVASGGRRGGYALTPAADSWRACTLWWCLPQEIRAKCSSPEALAKCAPGEMFRALGKEATRLASLRQQKQQRPPCGESEEERSLSDGDLHAPVPRRVFSSPSGLTDGAVLPRTVFSGSTRPRPQVTPDGGVQQQKEGSRLNNRASRSRERVSRRREGSGERASKRDSTHERVHATPSTPDVSRRRFSRSRSPGRSRAFPSGSFNRGACFHCNSLEHTIGGCQWWSDRRAADPTKTRVCPKCLTEGHSATLCRDARGAVWAKGPGPTTAGWRRAGRDGGGRSEGWGEHGGGRRPARLYPGPQERAEGASSLRDSEDRRRAAREGASSGNDAPRPSRHFR